MRGKHYQSLAIADLMRFCERLELLQKLRARLVEEGMARIRNDMQPCAWNSLCQDFRVARWDKDIFCPGDNQGRHRDLWQPLIGFKPVGRIEMPLEDERRCGINQQSWNRRFEFSAMVLDILRSIGERPSAANHVLVGQAVARRGQQFYRFRRWWHRVLAAEGCAAQGQCLQP